MGINYYLEKKDKSGWMLPISRFGEYAERLVYKQVNGDKPVHELTFNLDKCTTFEEGLHIGKASFGWHFNLCIYPFMGIYNLSDWEEMFSSDNYIIKDETGKEFSKKEMLSIITERSNPYYMEALKQKKSFEEYEQECVDRYNKSEEELAIAFHNTPEYCNSYDEILKQNHASRGMWGLMSHCGEIWDERKNEIWKDFMPIISHHIPTDGTYDLTPDWNFS